MININFNGIRNSFGSINLININFDRTQKKYSISTFRKKEFDFGKYIVISKYANFCSLSDFEVPDATMNKLLVESFYNVAIKLTKDFEFTDSQFEYFKNNFLAKGVVNKFELIEYMTIEKIQINRNDSRYYLGFRSIYSVINDNSEIISYEYLAKINKMLEPFFSSYKHKELLTFGLSFKEK